MQVKILNEAPQRVFAVIFEIGEDPVSGLTRFAEKQDLSPSSFTAIGAFSGALLGYFDWERKDYERIPVPPAAVIRCALRCVRRSRWCSWRRPRT